MKDKLLKPWNAEQWLWLFHQPDCDYRMLRRQIYDYTVQAVRQGSYEIIETDPETNLTQIKTISLKLNPDIAENTKFYSTDLRDSAIFILSSFSERAPSTMSAKTKVSTTPRI